METERSRVSDASNKPFWPSTNLEQAPESPQPPMSKERWSGIMRAAGMSDEDMRNWHREFEAREPLAHQEFLESLNLNR